ncbi:MAG: cyclodeaminase/cyclohydrolase family protein [Candidatus Eremiobacteraeota bacterium]|nr:cyclodeaminase/cyclohydrolase family protein [Candidatus Eremiobacteraeota bacterium]
MQLEEYLDALASEAPTPGGGSAAAIVGAFAAALVAMVARITRRSASTSEADAVIVRADALRSEFVLARTEDEAAYARVVAAQALPKNTAAEKTLRTAALQSALAGAAEAPLRAAELAVRALRLTEEASALGNANLASDVACAKTFARASLSASAANVRINHAFLRDAELVRAQETRLRALEREAEGE